MTEDGWMVTVAAFSEVLSDQHQITFISHMLFLCTWLHTSGTALGNTSGTYTGTAFGRTWWFLWCAFHTARRVSYRCSGQRHRRLCCISVPPCLYILYLEWARSSLGNCHRRPCLRSSFRVVGDHQSYTWACCLQTPRGWHYHIYPSPSLQPLWMKPAGAGKPSVHSCQIFHGTCKASLLPFGQSRMQRNETLMRKTHHRIDGHNVGALLWEPCMQLTDRPDWPTTLSNSHAGW